VLQNLVQERGGSLHVLVAGADEGGLAAAVAGNAHVDKRVLFGGRLLLLLLLLLLLFLLLGGGFGGGNCGLQEGTVEGEGHVRIELHVNAVILHNSCYAKRLKRGRVRWGRGG